MQSKVYKINLRGLDVSEYSKNPVVFEGFNYSKLPIGKARILKGKTRVEVKYLGDNTPKYKHTIGTSVIDNKKLLGLSVIPRAEL